MGGQGDPISIQGQERQPKVMASARAHERTGATSARHRHPGDMAGDARLAIYSQYKRLAMSYRRSDGQTWDGGSLICPEPPATVRVLPTRSEDRKDSLEGKVAGFRHGMSRNIRRELLTWAEDVTLSIPTASFPDADA